MISPFGGTLKRAASSAAVPRTTSSNRFVSSRQTANSRSGSTAASERSVAGSRCGDSKATAGQGQPRSSSHTAASRFSPAREEAEESVLLGDQSGGDERRLDRGRSGQHRHVDARVERGAHEPRPRIRHTGEPGVGDKCDPLPRLEPRQELGRPPRLVVLVVGEEAGGDPVALEENPRVTRVLAEHDIGCGELGEDAERHILEVADRRRADRERHQESSSASNPTKAAPMRPAEVPSSAFVSLTALRIGSSASRLITSSAGPRRWS